MTSKKVQLPRRSAAVVPSELQIFHTKQINALWQKTPQKFTHEREGRAGETWKYVTGSYVRSQLDRIFAYNWSFKIKKFSEEDGQIIVLGSLTGYAPYKTGDELRFHEITKEDFGRASIKKKRNNTGNLDLGNEYKAATTDALKRCAAQFGVARDIYSAGEIKEIEFIDEEMLEEQEKSEKMNKLHHEAELRLNKGGDPYEVDA